MWIRRPRDWNIHGRLAILPSTEDLTKMSSILCEPCQAIFTGVLLETKDMNRDSADTFERIDEHDLSLLSPLKLCRLCDMIRQQLGKNDWQVKGMTKQFETSPVLLNRRLLFNQNSEGVYSAELSAWVTDSFEYAYDFRLDSTKSHYVESEQGFHF